MLVYQINLPETANADEFVRFMNEEYIPSIHKDATRVGKVTSLLLLQSRDGSGHAFLWLVGWNGLSGQEARIDDEKVQQKFESFKAKRKLLGTYGEAAVWSEETK